MHAFFFFDETQLIHASSFFTVDILGLQMIRNGVLGDTGEGRGVVKGANSLRSCSAQVKCLEKACFTNLNQFNDAIVLGEIRQKQKKRRKYMQRNYRATIHAVFFFLILSHSGTNHHTFWEDVKQMSVKKLK